MVATSLWWDIHLHTFDWTKGLVLVGVVLGVAAAISRFTNRLLARPLTLLEAGITSVREGRLEPIRVSRTGDEIEYLGESFSGESFLLRRRTIEESTEQLRAGQSPMRVGGHDDAFGECGHHRRRAEAAAWAADHCREVHAAQR